MKFRADFTRLGHGFDISQTLRVGRTALAQHLTHVIERDLAVGLHTGPGDGFQGMAINDFKSKLEAALRVARTVLEQSGLPAREPAACEQAAKAGARGCGVVVVSSLIAWWLFCWTLRRQPLRGRRQKIEKA